MSHCNKFCQIPPTYSVWQFCNIFVQHCHYLGMSACRLRFVNSNARGNKNRQNVFLLSFTTTNKIFVSLSVLYVPSTVKIFSLFSCFKCNVYSFSTLIFNCNTLKKHKHPRTILRCEREKFGQIYPTLDLSRQLLFADPSLIIAEWGS